MAKKAAAPRLVSIQSFSSSTWEATFTGTASTKDNGATVYLFNDLNKNGKWETSELLGNSIVSSDGTWRLALENPLSNQNYRFVSVISSESNQYYSKPSKLDLRKGLSITTENTTFYESKQGQDQVTYFIKGVPKTAVYIRLNADSTVSAEDISGFPSKPIILDKQGNYSFTLTFTSDSIVENKEILLIDGTPVKGGLTVTSMEVSVSDIPSIVTPSLSIQPKSTHLFERDTETNSTVYDVQGPPGAEVSLSLEGSEASTSDISGFVDHITLDATGKASFTIVAQSDHLSEGNGTGEEKLYITAAISGTPVQKVIAEPVIIYDPVDLDLQEGNITATDLPERFIFDFQLVDGRATRAGDGEITLDAFDTREDILTFRNVSSSQTLTPADFMRLPGVVVAENPFAHNTTIGFDAVDGKAAIITLTGIQDAELTTIALEIV